MITNTHELAPLMFARGTPHPPTVPRWGSAWKAWMKANAQSVGSIDALPYEDTRLDLDPVVRDPHGVPVVPITHRIHDNERIACGYLSRRRHALLRETGAQDTWDTPHIHVEARHRAGGTRRGDDPQDTVVDDWGAIARG
jgi:hypothetical protein